MKKPFLVVILTSLGLGLLLCGCVTTTNSPNENMNASGTPSPLNTSANPWTNVNPQIQGQQQAARQAAMNR